MKNKYSITKKWEKKVAEMKIKADFKYSVLFNNKVASANKALEHEREKIERKKAAYIKKKEEEYARKCKNEIRELEGKPKKEYKTAAPKINPIQFAMAIAQENSKLRDTDANGDGYCISCNRWCHWNELAGGHRYSRKFVGVCLEKENINAQCNSCNFTTGPRGDTLAKERTNQAYDENIDKKFGKGTAARLKRKVANYFQGKRAKYDLKMIIPKLIDENEKLWKTKTFPGKPSKKRKDIWTRYCNRT